MPDSLLIGFAPRGEVDPAEAALDDLGRRVGCADFPSEGAPVPAPSACDPLPFGDAVTPEETRPPDSSAECGCAVGPGLAAAWWLPAGLLLGFRRRRR